MGNNKADENNRKIISEEAILRLKQKVGKTIVIYGDTCDRTSGNAKLVYFMAKAFQKEGHKVFTIGMDYNGPQVYYDNITILPGFHCETCGNSTKGSIERVNKIAQWLRWLPGAEYFICVGDPVKMQDFGMGNLTLEKSDVKAIMYATLDSEGMFTNERLKHNKKRDFLEICDRVISTSEFTKGQFKEWMDLDTTMIHETINQGVYFPVSKKTKDELRKEFRFKNDDFIMYYSGRNNMRKRVFDLIEACTKFICETNDTYLYLNIPPISRFENGDPIYPDSLNPVDFIKRVMKKHYGRDLLDEKRIIFVERAELGSTAIDEEVNAKFYQLSDVYVTTTAGEGFGLCPVESMACGVPVIVPDNSTGRETVGYGPEGNENPECGYKFADSGLLTNCPITIWQDHGLRQSLTTPNNTYEAIKHLHKDPELRKTLGTNGRNYVEKMFGFKLFEEKWAEVIKTTEKKKPESEFKKLDLSGEKKNDSKKV